MVFVGIKKRNGLVSTIFSFSLQAVINSTITPNMTFTKTSQKFGQWSDVRANTVYGLGFASEAELGKVCLHFYYNLQNKNSHVSYF